MYARFIPGQMPKHTPGALSNHQDSTSQTVELPKIQRFDDEPGPPTPKRKRDDDGSAESSKKAKKSERPGKDKKKEKKKEKKSKDTPADLEEEAPEDQRHKAVFERKEKSLKFAEAVREKKASSAAEQPEESPQAEEAAQVPAHGLEALPQPEPAPRSTEKPSYETLPPWLSAPIRVSTETRASFTDLGILPRAARILREKGFAEAFAVQTAAVPLLLPTSEERPGDVLISAATGSGKTLAYALPVTRDLSSNSVVTRLRALVVLPTRELVKQAQEVFEVCARAYEGEDRKRVRVGVAIGSQSLGWEQESLVGSETRYDPETYGRLEFEGQQQHRLGEWQGQVREWYSKVDVLICTPGRLVEHMQQTRGFTLSHVRWLVVDEADKLLSQSFQGWLDVVLESFRSSGGSGSTGARTFPDMPYEGVRKVVLSATLTRDLSLLSQLALRRPRLIVLEGGGDGLRDENGNGVAEHALPGELSEFAVRVHDVNLKPLYLLDLLRLHIPTTDSSEASTSEEAEEKEDVSDPGSDTSFDSDTSSDSSDSSDSDDTSSSAKQSQEKSQKENQKKKASLPMALIFTKSNESALRLSRLLALLDPSLPPSLATLTSNTPTSLRRRTLSHFAKQTPHSTSTSNSTPPLRLVIASDLVARGIDIPGLANVVNYDLPPSVAGYVHRVGRTARAGRKGCAWTLVADGESGWFWGKIAKGAGVRRARGVERVRVEEMAEERVEEYEAALEKLGREALGK